MSQEAGSESEYSRQALRMNSIRRKRRSSVNNSTKGRRRSIPSFQTDKVIFHSPFRKRKKWKLGVKLSLIFSEIIFSSYYGIEEERRESEKIS